MLLARDNSRHVVTILQGMWSTWIKLYGMTTPQLCFNVFHKWLCCDRPKLANSETTEGCGLTGLHYQWLLVPVMVSFPDHPMRNLGVEAWEWDYSIMYELVTHWGPIFKCHVWMHVAIIWSCQQHSVSALDEQWTYSLIHPHTIVAGQVLTDDSSATVV